MDTQLQKVFWQETELDSRVEEILLRYSIWARFAQYGARYADLYVAAILEQGHFVLSFTDFLRTFLTP